MPRSAARLPPAEAPQAPEFLGIKVVSRSVGAQKAYSRLGVINLGWVFSLSAQAVIDARHSISLRQELVDASQTSAVGFIAEHKAAAMYHDDHWEWSGTVGGNIQIKFLSWRHGGISQVYVGRCYGGKGARTARATTLRHDAVAWVAMESLPAEPIVLIWSASGLVGVVERLCCRGGRPTSRQADSSHNSQQGG